MNPQNLLDFALGIKSEKSVSKSREDKSREKPKYYPTPSATRTFDFNDK